jgi:hypothetical protein
VLSTVKAAAGPLTAVSTSVGILTKGVLKTMFLAKLKLAVGAVMIVTALGASGLVYRATGQSAPEAKRSDGKPLSEVERLRHENELLKLNLEVVLEKVRAQETELRALKDKAAKPHSMPLSSDGRSSAPLARWIDTTTGKQLEQKTLEALKRAVGNARNKEELQRIVDELEKGLKILREQLKVPGQLKKPESNKP